MKPSQETHTCTVVKSQDIILNLQCQAIAGVEYTQTSVELAL